MSSEPHLRRTHRRMLTAVLAAAWLAVAVATTPVAVRADQEAGLDAIRSDIVDAAREHTAATKDLADLRKRISAEQSRVADATQRRESANGKVQAWARVAYKSGGASQLAALIGADDLEQARNRGDYLQRIVAKANADGDEARAATEDASAALAELQQLEGKAAKRVKDVESLQADLEAKQAAQQKRIEAQLAAERAAAQEKAAQEAAAGNAAAAKAALAPRNDNPSDTRAPRSGGGGGGAPSAGGGRDGGTFNVTCYSDDGFTASGAHVRPGAAAVDPRVIPMGTSFIVEGYGVFTALDTGGAIKGNRIDIWNPSESWCLDFGRRNLHVTILG